MGATRSFATHRGGTLYPERSMRVNTTQAA